MPGADLRQKTVLITGCTPGGIGYALCLEYHRQARRPELLRELADIYGMSILPLDITNTDSIKACHAEVAQITGGKLDILVNNAGRTHTHPATDLDLDDVRQTFETNVFGMMSMVKAFAEMLIAAKGLIINTASASAVTPYLFGAAYTASKGAVVSYSRTLRLELAPLGVRVMVTMTGTTKSNTASHGHRFLPTDSLYKAAQGIFEWRLVFSQNSATMATDKYARQLVRESLKPEAPLFARSWLGRPDWFWYGGRTSIVWLAHSLGEWVMDTVGWYAFRVPDLQKALAQTKQK